LKLLTGSDYDLLWRRLPQEKFEAHLASDRVFIEELVTRCKQTGLPVQVPPEEISSLLYPLVLTILHQDDFGPYKLADSIDILLDLVAAYCLGELESRVVKPNRPVA
jgi:hypothetical protein